MNILTGLNKEKFSEEFLNAFLENGFTSMTKREIDLLVLRLLVEHRNDWSWEEPPTAFEMSQLLRVKRSRVRSMMDELSFRLLSNEEEAKRRLRKILEDRVKQEGDQLFESSSVRLQIEDGFLREFAKSLVQADFGIVDTSFDRSIMTLSGHKFLALVAAVLDEETRAKVEEELGKHEKDLKKAGKQSLWRMFLEGFVQHAGAEAGKKAIKIGAAALTGGLSEISDIIDTFFGEDGDSHVEGTEGVEARGGVQV